MADNHDSLLIVSLQRKDETITLLYSTDDRVNRSNTTGAMMFKERKQSADVVLWSEIIISKSERNNNAVTIVGGNVQYWQRSKVESRESNK